MNDEKLPFDGQIPWALVKADYAVGVRPAELSRKYKVSERAIWKRITGEGWQATFVPEVQAKVIEEAVKQELEKRQRYNDLHEAILTKTTEEIFKIVNKFAKPSTEDQNRIAKMGDSALLEIYGSAARSLILLIREQRKILRLDEPEGINNNIPRTTRITWKFSDAKGRELSSGDSRLEESPEEVIDIEVEKPSTALTNKLNVK